MSHNLIFAGTPDFAAQHLTALIEAGYNIVAVYTQPDRATGRGQKLVASPVKLVAEAAGIPVQQPLSLKDSDAQLQLANYNADLMVVVAYGQILPKSVLDTPAHGCINVHASLLPRWRGAAPIERAIEAGDAQSGVAIMQMDVGLDTGDVISEMRVAIDQDETAATLYNKLLGCGTDALVEAVASIFDGTAVRTPQQDDAVTYAHKIEKSETIISFDQPAAQLERKLRAFYPMRCCSFMLDGKPYKIHRAQVGALTEAKAGTVLEYSSKALAIACGDRALTITTLQPPGKKAQPIDQLINGRPDLFTLGQLIE